MSSEDKRALKWTAIIFGLWAAGIVATAVRTKEWPLLIIIPAFIIPLIAGIRFMLARNQERRESIKP